MRLGDGRQAFLPEEAVGVTDTGRDMAMAILLVPPAERVLIAHPPAGSPVGDKTMTQAEE